MNVELTEQDGEQLLKCLGDATHRLQAEFYLVKDGDLPREWRENPRLLKYKRPTRWRLAVWKQLNATIFKGLVDFNPGTDIYSCGVVIGVFGRVLQSLNSLDEEDYKILEEASFSSEATDTTADEGLKRFEALSTILDRDTFSSLVENEKPQELGQFYSGLAKGYDLIGTVDADGNIHSSRSTDATKIYLFLLIFGDFLETLRSVDSVYAIYQAGNGGTEYDPSPETFKQICKRVRFRGSSYRRRKQRIKGHGDQG